MILLYRGVEMADVVLGAFGMLAVLAYIASVCRVANDSRPQILPGGSEMTDHWPRTRKHVA